MERSISFQVSEDEYLVLFEFLSRFDESDELSIVDQAEVVVLESLLAKLEKELVQPFRPGYAGLVDAARARLRA